VTIVQISVSIRGWGNLSSGEHPPNITKFFTISSSYMSTMPAVPHSRIKNYLFRLPFILEIIIPIDRGNEMK
jgi:hypothetical protein